MNDTYIKNIQLIKSIDSDLFFQLRTVSNDNSFTFLKESDSVYSILKNKQKFFTFSITISSHENHPAYVFTSLLAFSSYILGNRSFSLHNSLCIINLENLELVNVLLLVFPLFNWMSSKNTIFVYDQKSLDKAINNLSLIKDLFDKPPAIFSIPHFEKIQSSSYLETLNNLKLSISFLISDFITTKVMLYRQIKNILLNSIFFTSFLQLPETPVYNSVCVVGAGQSLDYNLKEVKLCYDNNTPIIAVDTAYRILMKNNIIPAFVIILDPQALNLHDFLFCTISDRTLFILEISTHYRIIRHLIRNNAHFCFFSAHLTTKDSDASPHLFAHIVENEYTIPSMLIHGNVGIAGLTLGTKLGHNLKYYGYDSSFKSLIYHCKETLDQRYFLLASTYYKSMLTLATLNALQHSFEHRTSLNLLQNKSKIEVYKTNATNSNFKIIKNNKAMHITDFIAKQSINKTSIMKNIIKKGSIEKAFSIIYKKIPKHANNLIFLANKL